jgi:hypothetical protein
MTENLPCMGIGEHDKHPTVGGQPLYPINPPAFALKRSIHAQMVAREPRRNIAENHLKRRKLPRTGIAWPTERTAAAPTASVVLRQYDTRVVRARTDLLRHSCGRKGQSCRQDGNHKGAHDAKHARIDKYRSLNPE